MTLDLEAAKAKIERIRRWRTKLQISGAVILTVATVANLTGFEIFFMPLAAISAVCIWRGSYWAGWLDGRSTQEGAAQIAAAMAEWEQRHGVTLKGDPK